MYRSYEFYKKRYEWSKEYTEFLYQILIGVENDKINEDIVRNNGKDLLRMCVCEGNINLFKKLISPFPFKTGEIYTHPTIMLKSEIVRYHYLIDFFTLMSNGFLNEFPSSIMKAYVEDFNHRTLEEVSEDIVLLNRKDREEVLKVAYNVDYKVLGSMRVKDVLARQISGIGNPIASRSDVVYYSESATVIPSLALYDLNIATIANDTGGCFDDKMKDDELSEICINIDYDSLSEENKFAFDLMCVKGEARVEQVGEEKSYKLVCKAYSKQNLSFVIGELMQIVDGFVKQDYYYGKVDSISLKELITSMYTSLGMKEKCENLNVNNQELVKMANAIGLDYYYSEDTDTVWKNEDSYLRHLDYVKDKKLSK